MEKILLYDFNYSINPIDTQYGNITHLEWLQKEKERIERDKSRRAEIIHRGATCCLKVNAVPGCGCKLCMG